MVYFGISWYILVYFLAVCFSTPGWMPINFVDLTGVPLSASYRFIVYELLVSLAAAIALETDSVIKERIGLAQGLTVISWCTFPVVYLFPMRGINASTAVVSIQIDYCAYDIISKCGVESWFA